MKVLNGENKVKSKKYYMSYENPQAVINTESAKYYAAAISSIGKNVSDIINTQAANSRAQAKARKKQNLLDANNRLKFGSEYLATVNKSLIDFDMSSEISPQLNELIDQAADIKTKLGNMTQGSSEYDILKNDLNALETFFSVGLEQGLENFVGVRGDFSKGQASIGSEQMYKGEEISNLGLSASATQPAMVTDVLSTLPNSKPINRGFRIQRLKGEDGKLGAYNIFVDFGDQLKDSDISDFRKLPQRQYNINKDFGAESVVTNPNISNIVTSTLDDLKITKNGELNYKGVNNPSAGLLSIIATGETEIVKRAGGLMEIPKIDTELLRSKLNNNLVARIGGIVKTGDAEMGNLGLGINRMQSYVDDILPEKLDDMVGTLETDPSTEHGLTQESYDKLEYAITLVKKRQIEGGLFGTPIEEPTKPTDTEVKRGEKTSMLANLGKDLLTFDTLRPGKESGIRMDIIPDEKFQQELLTIGPGFTFNKIIDNEFIPLKVVGAPDSDSVQLPLKGLTDIALKKAMYLLAGGKKTDPIYKELGEDKKEVEDPYDVFAR
jgi:hypothetical protein